MLAILMSISHTFEPYVIFIDEMESFAGLDRPDRLGRLGRPDRPDRLDRLGRPDRPDRLGRPDRLDRFGKAPRFARFARCKPKSKLRFKLKVHELFGLRVGEL